MLQLLQTLEIVSVFVSGLSLNFLGKVVPVRRQQQKLQPRKIYFKHLWCLTVSNSLQFTLINHLFHSFIPEIYISSNAPSIKPTQRRSQSSHGQTEIT